MTPSLISKQNALVRESVRLCFVTPPLTFCENRCEYDPLFHLQTKYFSASISAIMLCKPAPLHIARIDANMTPSPITKQNALVRESVQLCFVSPLPYILRKSMPL